MVNKVLIIGNLGKDPEIRTLESGTKLARFPVATNENYRDRNGEWQTLTEWHDIVAWRQLADKADKLKKGMLVYIEGKLSSRKYTDKNNIERYRTEVVANYFRILEKKEAESEFSPAANESATSASSEAPATGTPPDGEAHSGGEQDTDDLPF